MAVTADTFRRTLGHFASGVTVVTMADDTRMTGLTVSAFSSVSLNPPYILVCIDKGSTSIAVARNSGVFAVNILARGQESLSNHFATRSEDKFSGQSYRKGPLGSPLLEDTLGYLECTVAQEVEAGDHIIFIGQVESAEVDDNRDALLYYHGGYHGLT